MKPIKVLAPKHQFMATLRFDLTDQKQRDTFGKIMTLLRDENWKILRDKRKRGSND